MTWLDNFSERLIFPALVGVTRLLGGKPPKIKGTSHTLVPLTSPLFMALEYLDAFGFVKGIIPPILD